MKPLRSLVVAALLWPAAPSWSAPAVPSLPRSALPVIEPARPSDLPALMTIERTSFSKAEQWDREAWAQAVRDPGSTVLVAREAGKPAASILFGRGRDEDEGLNRLYIASLGVHPAHRGKGYAEALVREAIARAMSDLTLAGASLHVRVDNEPAIGLYRKLGFQVRRRQPLYY